MKELKRFIKTQVRPAAAIFLACCMFFNPVAALAVSGGNVIKGGADIKYGPNGTLVDIATGKTVINWDSLNTAPAELLEFMRSSGDAFVVLNRVVKGGATQFNGMLQGNQGNIIIVNPNGIVFGPTALVQAHKFTASSLGISDEDFMNGVYVYNGGSGSVENYGKLTADQVALIGKKVSNSGTITSQGGYVLMAAGDKVMVAENGSNIVVQMDAVSVAADGIGDVVNEASGVIEAKGGTIVLASGDVFAKAVASDIEDAAIKVDGGAGRVAQLGTINADGIDGDGGSVSLTAGDVVAIGADSVTTANAGANGDGGEIIAYSPDTALFRDGASVQAKGGSVTGSGGFFEVSGHNYVETNGQIDLSAANGSNGTFLIDPLDLWIVDDNSANGDLASGTPGTWEPTNDSAVSELDIDTLEGYLDSADVTLSTLGTPDAEGQHGDVVFKAGRDVHSGTTGTSNSSLVVKASRNISFEANSGIDFEGNGGVELYASTQGEDATFQGGVTSVDRGKSSPNISTIRGDIIIEAGEGGINMGVIEAGESNTSGDLRPGEIRLYTLTGPEAQEDQRAVSVDAPATGYDITVEHLDVKGKGYGSVYVKSAGSLTINGTTSMGGAVDIAIVPNSDAENAKALVCLIAERDITLTGNVLASAHGQGDSVANIWIGAGKHTEGGYEGTVTINDRVLADASASGATMSDASVKIYGSSISVPTGSKAPQAKIPGTSYQGTSTGINEDQAVYVDEDGNVINNPDPYTDKLGSGARAMVVIDTSKDSTCIECANRVRITLPVAIDDLLQQSKNIAVIVSVLGNDKASPSAAEGSLTGGTIDLDGVFTSANGGTLVLIDGDTNVDYTPPAGWETQFNANGEYVDTFQYYAVDADGNVSAQPATVTVTLINQAPEAFDNGYGSEHNVQLNVDAATGALLGAIAGETADFDPDNNIAGIEFADTLTVTAGTFATTGGGSVTINADGSFEYTPSATNISGTDSFDYTISDGFGGTDTATVTLDLSNQAPEAFDNAFGSSHNVELNVDPATGALLGAVAGETADFDPDNSNAGKVFDDTLTVTAVAGAATAQGGTVTINADGSFVYTPSETNTSGSDSFVYTISDGFGGTDTATVTIDLTNQAPVANDNSFGSSHNVELSIADPATGAIQGTLNGAIADYDPDNTEGALFDDTLTVTPIIAGATANGGTVTLNADGTFTYTPSASNTSGTDSFVYTLNDGFGGTDTATVTIDLTNQAPVANDNSFGSSHNVELVVDPSTGALVGAVAGETADFDPDNNAAGKVFDDVLTVTAVTGAATANGGTVTINADGSFVYTPSASNTSGTDSFEYTISDGFGGTDTAIVTIDLTNQDPVANDNSYGGNHNVEIWVGESYGTLEGTLNNADKDYDPDNQTAGRVFDDVLVVTPITNGTTANGGTVNLQADGSFTYTPTADNKTGVDSFTYEISDGFGGTDTATVNLVLYNQAPVAQPDGYTTDQGVTLIVNKPSDVITGVIPLVNGDFDPDNDNYDGEIQTVFDDVLTAFLKNGGKTGPTNLGGTVVLNPDGTFTYIPPKGKSGPDFFEYFVTDGMANSKTVRVDINIIPKDEPPVIPTLTLPVPALPIIEIPEVQGCPVVVNAAATELGVSGDTIQVAIRNSLAMSPNIQPCDACANLVSAAATLKSLDAEKLAAINEAFNQFAPSDVAFTPELQASMTMAFTESLGSDATVASLVEVIDAFVEYVAILDNELASPVGDSLAFVIEKYGQDLVGEGEDVNPNLAAFLLGRVAANESFGG